MRGYDYPDGTELVFGGKPAKRRRISPQQIALLRLVASRNQWFASEITDSDFPFYNPKRKKPLEPSRSHSFCPRSGFDTSYDAQIAAKERRARHASIKRALMQLEVHGLVETFWAEHPINRCNSERLWFTVEITNAGRDFLEKN